MYTSSRCCRISQVDYLVPAVRAERTRTLTNMRPSDFALIIIWLVVLSPLIAIAADSDPGAIAIGRAPVQAPDCLTPTVEPQTIVGVWNCAALVEVRAS